ncbi:helix-turn-helix transcriptional regulator [Chitinophaga varians]|uniref:helix-turn-helix transcriptional regulator n=1 Tax=Chitinophaga varians TaxID=2202339 RepID=UPI00165FD0EC|nr:helix-turn-helix transcriptional regulator [Chitinophaga varians]MBC9911721.1 helix-turn-helix transcriptional regulator [Chitinophaga varians]
MKSVEQIEQFFTRRNQPYSNLQEYYAFYVGDDHPDLPSPFIRRNYYKITLILEGEIGITYADRSITVKDKAIIFSNPMIPYSWERRSDKLRYYFCLFTDSFVYNLAASPVFNVRGDHVLPPDETIAEKLTFIFQMMIKEQEGDYQQKNEVIRNYIQLLYHEAMKITPPTTWQPQNSAHRITTLFLELLAKQCAITTVHEQVQLKTAAAFATQLSIHVNYLNRAVKTVTGKTTTQVIADHLLKEAQTLLRVTSWSIGEIAYCLGFGHPSNFTVFFRKMSGQSPHDFRGTHQ